jgi:hypothetical protein
MPPIRQNIRERRNDVEGAVIGFPVVPEWLADNFGNADFFWRFQDENMLKAFALQPAQRPAQLRRLLPDDMRTKRAVGPVLVSLAGNVFRHIEHDDDRQAVKFTCQLHERFPRLWHLSHRRRSISLPRAVSGR